MGVLIRTLGSGVEQWVLYEKGRLSGDVEGLLLKDLDLCVTELESEF